MRFRLAAIGSALAALWAAGTVPAATAAPVTLVDGHVDYGARILGGELRSQIKDGTKAGPPVWREPSEVTFRLSSAAITTVPSGSKYGFLGPSGATIWMIPQVQRPGVLWAGWNTEEITAAEVAGEVAWRLDAVAGPGQVTVFQTGAFGQPDVIFNSGDGLPDTRSIPLGTHAHGNWSFSQSGEYRLTFTMSAERVGGGGPTADTETLAVLVEGAAGGPGPGGGGGSGGGGQGQGQGGGPAGPRVKVPFAKLSGRVLTVAVHSSAPGRAKIAIRRAGRRVAALGPRKAGPQRRRLRFRLAKPLAPGPYSVRVTVRTAAASVTRAVSLRVASRR